MGWFGLKGEGSGSSDQKPVIILPSQAEQKVAGVVVEGRRGEGEDWDFHPKVYYKRKKRLVLIVLPCRIIRHIVTPACAMFLTTMHLHRSV